MFGDNESVVNSSEHIHARLHKRHNALSFHRVRESIAASICHFHYIPGKINPADILSKHWGYNYVWSLLRPLMFWSGDTADIPLELWRFNVVGEWQKIHQFCIFSEVRYFSTYVGAQTRTWRRRTYIIDRRETVHIWRIWDVQRRVSLPVTDYCFILLFCQYVLVRMSVQNTLVWVIFVSRSYLSTHEQRVYMLCMYFKFHLFYTAYYISQYLSWLGQLCS